MNRFSVLCKYLILPSTPCTKIYTQRTGNSTATYLLKKSDYLFNRKIMSKKIVEQVAEMGRNKLLRKRTLEDTDPHTILVIT